MLGKIPAVPKPINLPSQRLENRGLDPSVEIVPRGTFSWGTGRSPPASSSSWGNVGLSSSPPINTGAWNTSSTNVQPVSSSDNVSGGVAQNPPRPLSAGSTRPLSAGTTRPSSASATSGRAWSGAPKLDEQLQPSRFNLLATVDFPTLGSEKNPNLRPQQNMAPSNRPTSADGTKERNLAHTGTSLNRPTSADGSKDRKPVYPGVASADRPTSADGSLVDKGRPQSDRRLPTFPPFVDGNLSDQRHPIYTGVVGHGTAGPGPGTHGQLKDDHNLYPPLVQHGIALAGSHMFPVGDIMHPGASQHDRYFNGPRAPHSDIERDVLVLPMDNRTGVYNSYPFDLGANHFDRSRVHHHPQSNWGPNHFDRSGVYCPPPRASEHSSHSSHGIMQVEPPPYGMETAMQREQGNRRDGFNTTDNNFGEQRAGWAGRNVVYIGSPIDSREPSVSTSGSGRELQKPDMFTTSWGHEPKHSGWGNIYSGDTSMGMRRGGASSGMYEQTTLLPGGSEDRHREESRSKGAGHAGEILHSVSLRGSDLGDTQCDSSALPLGAAVTGRASKIPSTGVTEISSSLRQNAQFHKQEETVKSLMDETMNAGPEFFKKGNDTWANGSPLPGSGASAGMQPLKLKQEDERNRVKQSKEPQRVGFFTNMANQRQEDNFHGNLQSKNSIHIADTTNSPNEHEDAMKNTNAKNQIPISQRLTKGNKKDDSCLSPSHESEESHCASKKSLSKVSEVNGSTSSSAIFSTSSGKECNSDVSSGVQVSSDAAKEASADAGSNGALGAVQAKSPTYTVSQDASASDHKAMPTAKSTFLVAPAVETVAIPSSEEEGQALNDDSNTKARRNAHSSRRPHHGRSMHEPHSVDKQHVNHGMVWAPVKTPTTVDATKEENPPNTEKAGKSRESIQHTSTQINHDKPMQPLQKHQHSEIRGQRHAQQVQQMQSAASSQQAQGQQMQEHPVVSNKKQPQQMHNQKVEASSKQQGLRTQQQQSRTSAHKESEQWMQQEQSTANSYKNQDLETTQSVVSSYPEQEQLQSQFAASSQREVVNLKVILPTKEQQEKAGESRPGPVVDKLDGRKNKSESIIYVPRPARNQQRQGREQEHDQRYTASSQRFLHKGERSVVEDQENQPSEISTLPVAQSSKNNDEPKTHHSRFSKQQKRHQYESLASSNTGERRASSWKKHSQEEKGEQSVKTCVPPLVAEPEDKEESKTYTRKLGRHQEMQIKQSAAGSHQEHSHTAEEHKKQFVQTPDSSSCESSTNKSEMKLYIPKHRKQNTHQQECAATGYEGQKSQEQTAEEAHLSNEKDRHYAQGSQLSGVESNVKKDGIELYTPKAARQLHVQGHQSTSRGHRSRQRNVDLAEGQAVRSPSAQGTVESPLNKYKEITRHEGVSDSMESKQSCVRDDSKLHAPYDSSQGKKEAKLYVAKPDRQQQLQHQQSVVNIDQGHVEVPMREGPLPEKYHQIPGTEPSKRKEEIKRYTPKPARQQKLTETSVVLEGKAVKETGDLSSAEQLEQQRSENDGRANEFEHGYRSRNHLTKPRKSAPSFSRPQMKTQPSLEDGTVDDHTSRVDETNGAVIFKEHVKDRESGFSQKRGFRQRNHDVAESPTLEQAEVVRPKQYQKQHYQYQPVTQQLQTFKPREEDLNVDYEHKFNTRQQEYGHNRFERREGPPRRGWHHGYGYRAADHTG